MKEVVITGLGGIVPRGMIKSFGHSVSTVFMGILALASCSKGVRVDNSGTSIDVNKIKSSECFAFSKDQIISYMRISDLPCVKMALEKGLDPNGDYVDTFWNTSTPYLMMALDSSTLFHGKHGDGSAANVIALLVSFGGNINMSHNGTSLIEAAMRVDPKYPEVALYLINYKPKEGQAALDANGISLGGTPMEVALELKNESFVSALLAKGAKTELSTKGVPPLVQALNQGLDKASTDLIKFGANVDVSDGTKNTALMLAMQGQLPLAFNAILPKTTLIDQANVSGETPLIASAKMANRSFFDQLLPLTEEIDAVDSYKKSAIFYLVQSSDLPRIKAAYARGASVQLMSSDSSTLLHYAGRAEVAEFLLQTKKMSIDEMNKANRTPVATAVELQNTGVLMTLVAHGGSLSYLYPNRLDSLLHVSVRNNDLATTRFLLSKNLEIEAQNTDKETPVFGVSSLEMAKLLAGHQAVFTKANNKKQNLFSVLFRNSLPSQELLEFLLDQGVSGNTYLDNGFTLVHAVVSQYGYPRDVRVKILDALIKKGTTLDAITEGPASRRIPALHLVSEDYEWIQYFAQKGASLSIADGFGRTLMSIVRNRIVSLEARLKLLEKASEEVLAPIKRQLANDMEIRDYLVLKNAT